MRILSTSTLWQVMLLMSLLATTGMAEGKEPKFPPPPQATVKTVSTALERNGAVMKVRQFHTVRSLDKVRKFYQRKWARSEKPGKAGYVESDAMAPWHLITRVEDDHLMTVQAQPATGGGTWGYLAVSRLPKKGEKPKTSLGKAPAMRGSSLVSAFGSKDVGQSAKNYMVENRYSLKSNLTFYRNHYREWRTDLDNSLMRDKMHALSFTNGRRKVNITLLGSPKGTQVVINSVKHDLL